MTDRISDIIDELNANNGTNHKMDVLKKHKDNALLQRVLKMTYDKATFTYGVSLRSIGNVEEAKGVMTLEEALNVLEWELSTREVTGNSAIERLQSIAAQLDFQDQGVFLKVINRDLRINMGRSNINKVFKGLIVKPIYMRCGVYNEKTAKKFNPEGAFVQLKADGTYREFLVENGKVNCVSRQGEEYIYPHIDEALRETGVDAAFFGELTVYRDGKLLDRATGNGILRKNEIPDDCKVVFDCWDVVSLKEYNNAINKVKGTTPYVNRWTVVKKLFPDHTHDPCAPGATPVRAIECIEVNDMSEALKFTAEVMNRGLEGTIIKERNAIFRDGTNPSQLKLKLEIDVDVRITGFHEGTPGTVREKTFGAMTFETDDGQIKGRTSGFNNAQLEDFNSRREELIGQIMTVTCNDITKGRDNDYYALSHPRFVEIRTDKSETDTLERALDTKAMAMMVDKQSEAA